MSVIGQLRWRAVKIGLSSSYAWIMAASWLLHSARPDGLLAA
jgi:hypothetical protein